MASLAAGGAVLLIAAVAALADRGHGLAHRGAQLAVAIFAATGLLGAATFVLGARPGEGLHLLYGVAIIAALPMGLSFAADAPPRARSGVLAAAVGIVLLIAWRLFATG